MAQRIGKYKISKREAELSAVDGATISGNLDGITDLTATGTSTLTTITSTGTNTFSGANNFSGAVASTGVLSLGNKAQSAGVLTSKVDTGILNHPTVFTTPAPAATQSAGAFTLTAAMFANGYILGTANATNVAVTMPAKAVMITLFGAGRAVGDTFKWYLHNAGTTVNQALNWTAATGATLVGQVGVQANAAVSEEDEVNGTSTGCFMTRLTNVDGTTITYRIS